MTNNAHEMLMAALKLKENDKTQPENRHADFLARELDKIIQPQPQASKGGQQ